MCPTQNRSNVQLSHRYRFTSTSGSTTAIVSGDLLGAAGGMCTVTNSHVTSIFQSLRVKEIEIWSPPASQGSATTCSVEFTGSGVNSSNLEYSDTSVSVSQPAHIRCRPPRNSLASFWTNFQSSTTGLFTIIAPTGSIIDLTLDLIFRDDNVSGEVVTVATATLGLVYYLAMDCVTDNGAVRYPPVSLTTTV